MTTWSNEANQVGRTMNRAGQSMGHPWPSDRRRIRQNNRQNYRRRHSLASMDSLKIVEKEWFDGNYVIVLQIFSPTGKKNTSLTAIGHSWRR
ncbi:hypothetical protein PT282_00375 [Bifidobacterium sp. ESL0763]|uniref:hypothetical protein n=1 Tax=Bifidobacterium sp. ESL0763 TaxID=2983227 RepID=UPI0023F7C16C|nr:hypothetical protein [Bifidobacterium sp. ESL0763]MDF7663140.1 hypothetical protein [Bifidobacterium sp. ESL0763]